MSNTDKEKIDINHWIQLAESRDQENKDLKLQNQKLNDKIDNLLVRKKQHLKSLN